VCHVPSTLETKLLEGIVGMKKGSSTIETIQFKPEEGETFETVTLEGPTCPFAGTYKITGTLWGNRPTSQTRRREPTDQI